MVVVTDKQYFIDDKLKKMMDLFVHRCTNKTNKLDALLIIDGYEGYGKTNMAAGVAYYFSFMSGRTFNNKHMFFKLDQLIEYAKSTKEQVIVWDEAALGGLSTESYNKVQTKLLQLLMVARKKRHFFIFNIPRFYRLKEAIIERALGLIHVYARNEVELGRFVYFKKKRLDSLYKVWKSSRKALYKQYYNYRGSFPEVLSKVIDEEQYDKEKDEAIMSIGQEQEKPNKNVIRLYQVLTMIIREKENYPNLLDKVANEFQITKDAINKMIKRLKKLIEMWGVDL